MGGSRSLFVMLLGASLMIIDDLDAFRGAFAPDEADSPLIIDPYTMLALSIAAQGLQPIPWNRRQVLQPLGIVQHAKLPPCHGCNVAEFATQPQRKKHRLKSVLRY